MLPSQIPIDEMFDLDAALTMAVDSSENMNHELEVDDQSKVKAAAAAAASRLLDEVPTVEAPTGGECAVCSEGLRLGGGAAKRIPCGHVFHRDCIFRWLSVINSCPLCREKFPAPANISSG